ncbi:MAG TPA: ferritin [Firmicutes bacterium]|jgi:ferritin|nr:ferritin [Bacillota bacterium]
MLPEKVEQMLNDQIQKELYSAYLYLSMSAYLEEENLKGYAHWFMIQAQEERDHALIIYNYVLAAGGRVKLQAIQQPPVEFAGLENVLTETLAHEQFVTSSIYEIVEVANEARDHKTVQMLQWFIEEQVEEEDNARNNIDQYRLFGTDPKGLYMLDREMAQRVYTVPAPLATAN